MSKSADANVDATSDALPNGRATAPDCHTDAVMKVQLKELAHARSGDKGDTANVGLIALREELYPLLVHEVTAARVKEHFRGICHGKVERFELANLGALNFLLHESLGGGGTLSLMTDAQGKTFSTALLRMEIDISDDEARELGI